MHFSRAPRLSRLLVLLALFQVVAPSVAAIADAWRMDRRESYVHMESESSAGCPVVHAHDCLLCSVATSASGDAPRCLVPISAAAHGAVAPVATIARVHVAALVSAPPRAPPHA